MQHPTQADMEAALAAIDAMLDRSVRAQAKFRPGTAQHTLLENRNRALALASALLREACGLCAPQDPAGRDGAAAAVPIRSLLSKSEKALAKLRPGTWQYARLETQARALALVLPLLTEG